METKTTLLVATLAALAMALCSSGCAFELPSAEKTFLPPDVDTVAEDIAESSGEAPVAAGVGSYLMDSRQADIEIAMADWESTFGGTNQCNPRELRLVEIADEGELASICQAENVQGCFVHQTNTVVMRVWPGIRPRVYLNVLVHELMHWLAGCSGAYPDHQRNHDDPAVWSHEGVKGRVVAALTKRGVEAGLWK